jgi:hypothetical protein
MTKHTTGAKTPQATDTADGAEAASKTTGGAVSHASVAPEASQPGVNEGMRTAMETLPEGHTYRDRVEAQAKALNITVGKDWTLERLLREVREAGSA